MMGHKQRIVFVGVVLAFLCGFLLYRQTQNAPLIILAGQGVENLVGVNDSIGWTKLMNFWSTKLKIPGLEKWELLFPQKGVARIKFGSNDSVSVFIKSNATNNADMCETPFKGWDARIGNISDGVTLQRVFASYGPAPDVNSQWLSYWFFADSGLEYSLCGPVGSDEDMSQNAVKRWYVSYPTTGINFYLHDDEITDISIYKPYVYDDRVLRRLGQSIFRQGDVVIEVGTLEVDFSDKKNLFFAHKFKNITGGKMLFKDEVQTSSDNKIKVKTSVEELDNGGWMYLLFGVKDLDKEDSFELILPYIWKKGGNEEMCQLLVKGSIGQLVP